MLNPLLLLHFIGAAHNDAPMVAITLAAIWVACRWPGWWSIAACSDPVLVGVAMAFKQQGGLAVIAVAGLPVAAQLAALPLARRLWLLGWRTAVATVVTLVTFVADQPRQRAGLRLGAVARPDGAGGHPGPARAAVQGRRPPVAAGGGSYTGFLVQAGRVGTLILLLVLVWIGVRFADRPLSLVAWGSLAIAVLGQALHPWYLPWSLALLGLVPLTRRQRYWVFGFAIAFCVWNAIQTVIWHGQN